MISTPVPEILLFPIHCSTPVILKEDQSSLRGQLFLELSRLCVLESSESGERIYGQSFGEFLCGENMARRRLVVPAMTSTGNEFRIDSASYQSNANADGTLIGVVNNSVSGAWICFSGDARVVVPQPLKRQHELSIDR